MPYTLSLHDALPIYREFRKICKEQPELNNAECYKKSFNNTLTEGGFDQCDFYTAFMEFDNQSIDKSLTSENPIVRLFAILDRRVGKRRLSLLKARIGDELEWLQPFYLLRLTAENCYKLINQDNASD